MRKHAWLYAIALAAAPFLAGATLQASEIRDKAGMFSASAVRKATAELDRTERQSGVSVVIETIPSLPNVGSDASQTAKYHAVQEMADRRAREIGHEGVYMLISQKDRAYSEPLVQERYASMLPRSERQAVGKALAAEFKKERYDDGLLAAVGRIDQSLSSHAAPAPAQRIVPDAAMNHRAPARFGIGSLISLALGIFGVLLLFRVLGGIFRGASPMGGPGYGGPGMGGPGYGPGMGGPGYGYGGGYGRGGGFFSNMLGGLGGALAGNWLYDQFSGRHGSGHIDASSYTNGPDGTGYTSDPGGDNYVGGDDNGGMGGGWGEPDDAGSGGWFSGGDGGGGWSGGDGGGDWGGGGDAGGGW